ncbi:MAG: aminotransferase class V-fold PLP-dependent enzyme [Bryobacteraceae bacterium]|nr:aminotransferase class V-fold PLP-dependent enzyme [Bryobacteraceae bacterium]
MGYETFQSAGSDLRARYRDQFPVTGNVVYLNHASVSPLCKPAADAIKTLADDALQFGSLHYDQWLDAYEGLRVAAASLIGGHRDEIAIVKNTSEGIATVAMGLKWQPGDKVVAFREEFPANALPWLRLEEHGVRIEWLSYLDELDRIEEAARGARLLAISYVQFLSGYRANLAALGEICRRHNVFFFVDAIQGLGVFPLDVDQIGIDALAADGHKWLTGPEGCGILYVRKSRQEEIEPVEFGWTNIANYADYASRDMTLRPDAGRYECGTLNTVGIYGLRAAIEFLNGVGIPAISGAVTELADQVAAGAQEKGYELMVERTPATSAAIVSIRKEGIDSRMIVRHLKELRFLAAPRQGWVRISPHFYISPEDIGNLLDALP